MDPGPNLQLFVPVLGTIMVQGSSGDGGVADHTCKYLILSWSGCSQAPHHRSTWWRVSRAQSGLRASPSRETISDRCSSRGSGKEPGCFLGSGPYVWELAPHHLIAGQSDRVPFKWLLHAGYHAFLCATYDKTRISSCALLELVYRLETNLAITCRVYFPEAWCTMQKLQKKILCTPSPSEVKKEVGEMEREISMISENIKLGYIGKAIECL